MTYSHCGVSYNLIKQLHTNATKAVIIMIRHRKTIKNRRDCVNQIKINPPDSPLTNPVTTYPFDYGKLRDTLIDANRSIIEAQELSNKEAFENDHLTRLLVELLNTLFTFVMVLIGIFSFATFISSCKEANAVCNMAICLGCWLAFISGVCILLVLGSLRRKGKISNNFWFKLWANTSFVLILGSFIFAYFSSSILFLKMVFVVVLTILFSFCYLAMQSLKHESDRAYLVSYFSAITGIAALVVSAISLIVTMNQ